MGAIAFDDAPSFREPAGAAPEVPATAFVTGGSGFIGGRLVERLAGAGCRVRALARSDASAAAVERLGAEPVRGDLADPASMRAGAEGCEAAFHLAAHLGQWGTREEFVAGNVTGTENALAAAREAGVRRFVHCGTEAALLAGEPLRRGRRDARPCAPTRRRSTRRPRRSPSSLSATPTATGSRPWSCGRASSGASGDTTLLPELVAHGRGRASSPGSAAATQLTDITHVDNVVEGLLLRPRKGRARRGLLRHRRRAGRLPRVRLRAARDAGRRAPDPFGAGMARRRRRGGLSETAWRVLRLGGEPPLTRFAFWISSQECTIEISKARAELGYEPVVSREQGLAELSAR